VDAHPRVLTADQHATSPARLPLLGFLQWRRPAWLAPALLVAIGYYLAARLGFALTLQPHPISTLWPPNALLLSALLLSPVRAWWWLLAAALPAHLLAELQSGVPVAMVLGWYTSNCSEALIGAGLAHAIVRRPLRLDSLRDAGIFLACCALAAPLLSSFLDAGFVRLVGWGSADYWKLVGTRFFSNVLAELTIVPLVLAWAAFGIVRMRRLAFLRYLETAAIFGALLAVCLFVFDVPAHEASLVPALFYAPLPFLLWATVRLGIRGTTSALALLTLATIWGAVHGLGPFANQAPQETARNMQLFLTAVSAPMLLLAVALEERARIERDARNQLAHLSRVAMLGDLSGGIAHELNQPLTAILSNAQAAQQFIANKAMDNDEMNAILQDIIAADRRAGEVIARLRALFKRSEAHFQHLDLNDLVREVMSLAHGELITRGVDVVLQLSPGLPLLRGDRIQLEQVMLNIVMNASDAMTGPKSERRRVIKIRTVPTRHNVHLSFADSGPGLTPEVAGRLFEPFYTTKAQGLGLGLSISRSIVSAHGGRLWAMDMKGQGAMFSISLPRAKA